VVAGEPAIAVPGIVVTPGHDPTDRTAAAVRAIERERETEREDGDWEPW
jgi:hypothetical protein